MLHYTILYCTMILFTTLRPTPTLTGGERRWTGRRPGSRSGHILIIIVTCSTTTTNNNNNNDNNNNVYIYIYIYTYTCMYKQKASRMRPPKVSRILDSFRNLLLCLRFV